MEQNPQEEKPKRRRVKKVKGGHGGHHGGAWKVAYADFVTAMMALFLVLWLVSQADTKLKKEIANYFRSPGVFSSTQGGILPGKKKVSREPSQLTEKDEQMVLFEAATKLKRTIDSSKGFEKLKDKVKIEVVDEGIQVQILDKADNVSFQVGGSELNEEAKTILEEIAKTICSLPNPIKIGGHTDARVFPSENGYTNWELSTDRANAARRFLQSVCVKPEQIKRITGYANTNPLIKRDIYHPANRRISITILRINQDDGYEDTDKETKPESTESETSEDGNYSENIKSTENKPARRKTSKTKPKEEKTSQNDKSDLVNPDKKNTGKSDVKTEKSGSDTKESKTPELKKEDQEYLRKKLVINGKVSVGKPDIIPDVAKKREPPKKQ